MRRVETLRAGTDAVDRNGDKIGTVDQVGTSYFVVRKGRIFTQDLYVPMSAVHSVDPEGYVRLNVDKDQIDSMGWDRGVSRTGEPGYAAGDALYGTTQRSETAESDSGSTVDDRTSERG